MCTGIVFQSRGWPCSSASNHDSVEAHQVHQAVQRSIFVCPGSMCCTRNWAGETCAHDNSWTQFLFLCLALERWIFTLGSDLCRDHVKTRSKHRSAGRSSSTQGNKRQDSSSNTSVPLRGHSTTSMSSYNPNSLASSKTSDSRSQPMEYSRSGNLQVTQTMLNNLASGKSVNLKQSELQSVKHRHVSDSRWVPKDSSTPRVEREEVSEEQEGWRRALQISPTSSQVPLSPAFSLVPGYPTFSPQAFCCCLFLFL